jgi:tetratricopeptide (TPR) repeat protein
MMDQIIQRLPSTKDYGVLQTDYVLEVLKRASVPLGSLQPEHIQQIFKVSGAELIVSSKLFGTPHDYQLSYVFNYRNSLKKGVLLNRKIQSLIDEFSILIAAELGNELLPLDIAYQADFNNELLGAAIENNLEGNYLLANSLLESIVLNNPENVTAQRLYAENLFRLKKFKRSFEHLDSVIPLAQKLKDKGELTRLLYSKALFLYATRDDTNASNVAVQALANAKENNDWLFMAHIKNIQANIAVNNRDYELAEKLYIEEKQHHQVLRCPVGESIAWANLARLAKIQNQQRKFTTAINQAINIASTRELSSQLSYFIKIKEGYLNQ